MAVKNVTLGTGETVLIQSTVGKTINVLSMLFLNNDSLTRNINVSAYPGGGTFNEGLFLKNVPIPAEDTFKWESTERFILQNTDTISASASVGSQVNVVINYYEV